MTNLSSTSVSVIQLYSSLPNKALRRSNSIIYFSMIVKCTVVHLTRAYTNYLFSTLLYWLFSWNCRKCLNSTWTFNALRPQRHDERCVTLYQDNHTCGVCHSPLRWLYILLKGRRASPQEAPLAVSVESRSWQIAIIIIRGFQLLWDT